jgi:hypothetical protein
MKSLYADDTTLVTQYNGLLQTGRPELVPRQRKNIFPLASVSRPALRPTQPPIQWVSGVKHGRCVTLITHPSLVPTSRMSRSHPLPLSAYMASTEQLHFTFTHMTTFISFCSANKIKTPFRRSL